MRFIPHHLSVGLWPDWSLKLDWNSNKWKWFLNVTLVSEDGQNLAAPKKIYSKKSKFTTDSVDWLRKTTSKDKKLTLKDLKFEMEKIKEGLKITKESLVNVKNELNDAKEEIKSLKQNIMVETLQKM